MSKYGLNIRVKPSSQHNKLPAKPLSPLAPGFGDDDENDVDKDIARQATKKKALKDIEEQHKKALEIDPSVFDYDGVYDQMKEEIIRPRAQDREKRESKYIQTLMVKAKERKVQQEMVYDRQLQKERIKDDHLFADKEKFVTSAYKKQLAEREKWMEEERLRDLREKKDDVTKKSNISDFYFNLANNVAFGAKAAESTRQVKQQEEAKHEEAKTDTSVKQVIPCTSSPTSSHSLEGKDIADTSPTSEKKADESVERNTSSIKGTSIAVEPSADQKKQDNHKRSVDAVSAAKERFLARKRAKPPSEI